MSNKKINIMIPFLIFNFALSLFIGLPYFSRVSFNWLEIIFAIFAYISNTSMIYIGLVLLTAPFFAFKSGKYFYVPVYVVFQMMLIIDVAVFKIFKFHINSMVINLLSSKGGFATLDQGLGMKIFAVFLLLLIIVLEIWFIRLSVKMSRLLRKKAIISVLAVLALFVLADKAMYAWGDLKNEVFIIRNSQLFPLYQPFTINHFAAKHFGFKADKKIKVKLSKKRSRLDYPKNKILFDKKLKNLPNIVFLVVDSLRYDMMTPDIMPHVYKHSKKSLVFKNHYSGGNCTRFGIFSLFYGIYGNYWFNMLGERRSPVMMDVLKEFGYDIKLYAATTVAFPEFSKTCFVNIPSEDIYDNPKASDKVGKDIEISEEFRKYLAERKRGKPYFSFVFFDSSHGSYNYPKEMEKFKPSAYSFNYLTLNEKKVLPIFNRFKNSLLFCDSLIGNILNDMEKTGGFENTIIVITGDHGEPFFEKGYHGHNQAYTDEEIKVPMIFYIPEKGHKVFNALTGHIDIPPTILELLKIKNPASDYSGGMSMLAKSSREFVSSFSWDTAAIIKEESVIVLPLSAQRFSRIKMFDKKHYKEIKDKKTLDDNTGLIWEFQKEAQRFYK